jgi:galactokinase/mevalonate kinase-like predicted kinase
MPPVLLSVPPRLRDFAQSPAGRRTLGARLAEPAGGSLFIGTDPRKRRLGSGGGTVHLLHQAWLAEGGRGRPSVSLWDWLGAEQRLVLHAGGESRRLPAYAAIGKALMPMPAVGGLAPRRFDQMLADFQLPAYRQVLHEAGPRAAVLVTAGDVWLDFDPLQVPAVTADIVGIGMPASPEVARDFGVFFTVKDRARRGPGEVPVAFFLQKPAPAEIRSRGRSHDATVDTGMWLLSVAALRLLFRRCGWDERRRRFATADGHPAALDLYTEIGAALGTEASPPARLRRLGWSRLTTAVIPLGQAGFHHLGSTRQLFESFAQIQRGRRGAVRALASATPRSAWTTPAGRAVWLDGVATRRPLQLDGDNAVTGLPAAARLRRLARRSCVDVAPVGAAGYVFRPYHLDDTLRGTPAGGGRICGRNARDWLAARGLPAPERDVFDLPIYPVIPAARITPDLLAWYFAADPDPRVSARVAAWRRLSARAIPSRVNFRRYFAQRRAAHAGILRADFAACRGRTDDAWFSQDFAAIAAFCRREAPALGRWLRRRHRAILDPILRPEHASRLLLLLAELSGGERARWCAAARHRVQNALVASHQLAPVAPRLALSGGRIARARSPVRLDLAGGWTDTPPYCLEHGGAVLNVAVLLNGRPPIQVLVRPLREPLFRLRSIDLGWAEDVATYAQLAEFRDPAVRFGLTKAALAVAGFLPDFFRGRPHRTLREQLGDFGGGLEISVVSEVPKGSGLGTSSILAATLLAALNRACGLGWGRLDLYRRVLGIEQLLTTGGGWQDQAGALFPGLKLVRTTAGPAQAPTVRPLPAKLLRALAADSSLLLYYTGLTRLAKGILQEIVHDMALGRSATVRTLDLIRANALRLGPAMRAADAAEFRRCIARSWDLNRRLDAGTTTPAIDRIIAAGGEDLAAGKLLGAGGGGYLLLCATDSAAGRRLRARLERRPPNSRAGFVDFGVSARPLETSVIGPAEFNAAIAAGCRRTGQK